MATAAAAQDQQFEQIDIGLLRPSPTNPRKNFDGEDELVENIRDRGVYSPLLVRPSEPKGFEIVDGERRWRAGRRVKLAQLPCIVRVLTDAEVVEYQLISTVQRKDLHPLEQADGYRTLMEKHGYDVERIAAKIRKGTDFIRRRLVLCNLVDKGRELLLTERMTLDAAVVLARMPDPKNQTEAIKELTSHYEFTERGATITGRRARDLVDRRFMLVLKDAPFPTGDAQLVPDAGACGPCPHRTGNQAELFGDVKGKEICTKPSCYQAKKEAFADRKVDQAKEAGIKVLPAKETKEVFNDHGDIAHDSGYVKLDGDVGYDIRHKLKGNASTWKQALGKNAKEVEVIVAKDNRGGVVELVDKKAAIAALKKADKLKKPERETASPKEKERRAKEKQEGAIRERAVLLALGKIADKAATINLEPGSPKAAPFWRWVLEGLMEGGSAYSADLLMQKRRPGKDDDDVDLNVLVDRAKTAGELRSLAVEVLAAEAADSYSYSDGDANDEFQTACRIFGVDWKETLKEAKRAEDLAKEQAHVDKAIANRELITGPAKKPAKKGRKS